MSNQFSQHLDLKSLKGVVAPEIINALTVATRKLNEAGIPHALAGGLAVGVHGYPRTTDDVDFLVGDEAFEKHSGGLVTLKLPLIAIGDVRIDYVSFDDAKGSPDLLRRAIDQPEHTEGIPVVPITILVYMKLKAGRQKDLADLVELMKAGAIELNEIDTFLDENASELTARWNRVKSLAKTEE